MYGTHIDVLAASSALDALRAFVSNTKLHPILVDFTAALIPTSLGTDIAARILKKDSLRATAWWTMFIGACITPFTVIAGWLFWMKDDVGVTGMTIHKWLGTSLGVLVIGLVIWRWQAYKRNRWPSILYFCVGLLFVAALIVQGHLGGAQTYSGM